MTVVEDVFVYVSHVGMADIVHVWCCRSGHRMLPAVDPACRLNSQVEETSTGQGMYSPVLYTIVLYVFTCPLQVCTHCPVELHRKRTAVR